MAAATEISVDAAIVVVYSVLCSCIDVRLVQSPMGKPSNHQLWALYQQDM